MYYIGIDGGGTKTQFGLYNDKQVIETLTLPTCHFAQVGYDGCAQVVKKGIDFFVEQYQLVSSNVIIGAGIAGYGNDKDIRNNIEQAINKVLADYTMYITNDVHVALLGALNGQDGCVVIAGTGSIALQKEQDKITRVGGWGYLLGDEGSGYWIGKQMLSMFTKQADHRCKRTALYRRMKEYYQIDDPYAIINVVNSMKNQRTEIAKLSLLCDTLANEKDPICMRILEEAAKEVAALVMGLTNKRTKHSLVSYYGSIFHSSIFNSTFTNHLRDYKIIKPLNDAVYGAVLFAQENI